MQKKTFPTVWYRVHRNRQIKISRCYNNFYSNWAKHIDNIKAKASRKMGILRRGKRFLPKSALTNLYKSGVHSFLEYAAPVWQWAAKSHLDKLDSIQNKAKKILNITDDQAIDYKIQPQKHRRDVASLCVFYRIKPGMAPSDTCKIVPPPMKQQRANRSTTNWSDRKVEVQRSKTDYHQNSFIPHISRLWNRLLCDVVGDLREPNLQQFKKLANDYFLQSLTSR
jgi:hypothetical protein